MPLSVAARPGARGVGRVFRLSDTSLRLDVAMDLETRAQKSLLTANR